MQQENQKLYVGNLHFEANEEQVKELFATYGNVQDVKIVFDRISGRSRGFAFIRMATSEDAGKAKEALNGQPFLGKTLVIDWARAEQDRPRRDRGPMGAGGGGEFRPRRERSDRGGFRGGNNSGGGGNYYNR